jgi:hypothetical protein
MGAAPLLTAFLVLAPYWGLACASFDWRDLALLASAPAAVGLLQLGWLRSLSVLRPEKVPLFSPAALLHRLGATLYILYGASAGLVAGIFGRNSEFKVTPKGPSGERPPPALGSLVPLLALSSLASLTLLSRGAVAATPCLGTPSVLFSRPVAAPVVPLGHAALYLAASCAIVALHARENPKGAGLTSSRRSWVALARALAAPRTSALRARACAAGSLAGGLAATGALLVAAALLG